MMASNFRPPSGGNPKKRRRTSTPISSLDLAPPPMGPNDTIFAANPFEDCPSSVGMPLGSPSGPTGMSGHGIISMGGHMLMHSGPLANYGSQGSPNIAMFGPCGPMFHCGQAIPTSCSVSGPNLCTMSRSMHSPMPQSNSAPGSVSPHRSAQSSGPGTPVGPLSGGLCPSRIGPHGPSSVGPPSGHQGMGCHIPPGPASHPNMVLGPMTSVSNERIYPPGQPMIFNPHNPSAPPIYPCGICRMEVGDNDQAILCESGCNFWFHRVCTGLAEPAFHFLTQGNNFQWVQPPLVL